MQRARSEHCFPRKRAVNEATSANHGISLNRYRKGNDERDFENHLNVDIIRQCFLFGFTLIVLSNNSLNLH